MKSSDTNSSSPYAGLANRQFWRAGVSESSPIVPLNYYTKKFDINPNDAVATAGSCFAQHISREMRARGFSVLDAEPAPSSLPTKDRGKFGYELYSARYGNIYTVRQLLQLVQEAVGLVENPEPVWKRAEHFVDSARPAVEPEGFIEASEVLAHRIYHLAKVKQLLLDSDVFVFTLGLTEGWILRSADWVFPMAPGILGGSWDQAKYQFKNFTSSEIIDDFYEIFRILDRLRSGRPLKYVLTVSPVPLTATFENQHVLISTTYSKSVLRAAAGQIAQEFENVDYFPSYEIISNPWNRGVFYDSNSRTVNSVGVDTVMNTFFSEHQYPDSSRTEVAIGSLSLAQPARSVELEEPQCEEYLLARFEGSRS